MTADKLDDSNIRSILEHARVFAVIGASPKSERPSYGVMAFLLAHGYKVHPVNPGRAGQKILGQPVYATIADVPGPVDVVDVFRASDAVPDVVRDAITDKARLGLSVIWMQLGVINENAAIHARDAGLAVVMDRCPKIEIGRLGIVNADQRD